ncbi:hypothetical protein [Saccharibacillus alkalitolerans]|uniref:S9 family peptidase n=1 Tax=Saccharibacillus alkalitolerans TaxID=2705290 RepID=A0ABX0F5P9_9BACL|nr:hypothetical protein [Saccharibacillus alkalitolerans]NGZ75339.1 hypothetical protein [Saccharibacillus alkalitolerans]
MMKLLLSKVSAALLLCAAAILPIGTASAAAQTLLSDRWLSAEKVLPVGGGAALLRSSDSAAFLDLDSGRLKRLLPDQKTLDAEVLSNPLKVVLLTAGESGKIEKHVYDGSGKEISSTVYKLKLPERGEARWGAPSAKAKEQLAVRGENLFVLYDSGGHQVLRYDAGIQPSAMYEYVSIEGWDFSAYPYLAIQYQGQRIMASDFFVRTVNLYNKSVRELPSLEIYKQLKIDARNRLQVWNSFGYNGIRPANAASPDPAKKQSFHTVYNLDSGKVSLDHALMFDLQEGLEPSGWETQVAGNYVFVRDLTARTWNLYAADASSPVASAQKDLATKARFLRYDPASKKAYFLVDDSSSAGKAAVRTISF